jgi:hypothetical protein
MFERYGPVLVVAGALASLGCPCGGTDCSVTGPGGLLDLSPVLNRLDLAATNIGSDGDRWVGELDSLARYLVDNKLPEAATYIRDTLQNGIARVGVEFRCNVDFTARRVRQGIQALRDAIASAKKDTAASATFDPFVCTATPDHVAWAEAPQVVNFAGYDFRSELMSIVVVGRDGAPREITSSATQPSPYQFQVNLSGAGAGFPRDCARIEVRSRGTTISSVPCLTDCPPPPPPTVIPAKTVVMTQDTRTCNDAVLTGCRADWYTQLACPNGYVRVEPFEVSRVAGRGNGNCGEDGGDYQHRPGTYATHWQSADPHDCSIHEHIGLQGGTFNGFQTCRFVVTAIKPQEVIPHPAPQVGWCR